MFCILKMFSWTIVPVSGFDMTGFINLIIDNKPISDQFLRELRSWIFKCKLGVCLRSMVSIALDILERQRDHARALSFIVEFVAGMKYAYDDSSVGKMRELKAQFNCCSNRHAIEFLKLFCTRTWNAKGWMDKDMWFQLRVHCMDAYVLSHMLNTDKSSVIYYAGASHTQNVTQYLIERKLATVGSVSDDPVWKQLGELCDAKGLTHCAVLKLEHTEVFIAGEQHSRTDKSFGIQIVDMLREFCHTKPILFLIEKHISNRRDKLQCDLMCNQPKLAIHQSRCSSFVETEHMECTKLQVLPVDNRHTDMGFMRVELMDLWDDDEEFRTSSQEFQRSSLLSMYNFCTTLLLCNEMRNPTDHSM